MCNVTSANATNNAKAIADLLLPAGRAAEPPASEPLNAEEGPRYAGLYRSLKPAGMVTISVQKDRLASSTFGPLTRVARHRFDAGGAYVLEFDGRFLRVTDEFGTADDYERVEPWVPGVQELKPIAGRYVSDELQLTMQVTLDGDRLIVRRPEGTLVLNPRFPDGFQSGAGWVIVRRDASGRVVGLSVNQERVWDLRFTRQAD
jgi:hypothetical protein